jgi:hypothetical protein
MPFANLRSLPIIKRTGIGDRVDGADNVKTTILSASLEVTAVGGVWGRSAGRDCRKRRTGAG